VAVRENVSVSYKDWHFLWQKMKMFYIMFKILNVTI
jgi:hypothetical protein